jgi:hypothetical protein
MASLEKNGTWIEVNMSKAKTRKLLGTWVFRRKRAPDGEISKFKARYCVRGDLEEGEPETFAPVKAWSSVRLFLVLSLTPNWGTCPINFSSAFVQAKLQDPVWVHMPRGFPLGDFGTSKQCLRLIKSRYGLSVALWFEHVWRPSSPKVSNKARMTHAFSTRKPSWSSCTSTTSESPTQPSKTWTTYSHT